MSEKNNSIFSLACVPQNSYYLFMETTQTTPDWILAVGNTYQVKDQLKALGARWNAERKAWMVPCGMEWALDKILWAHPSIRKEAL